MSHQWTMEDFESIYSRFKSSGLSVMDFCSNAPCRIADGLSHGAPEQRVRL